MFFIYNKLKYPLFLLLIAILIGLSGCCEAEKKGESQLIKDKIITLPQPKIKGKISLEEAIYKRRSKREFSEKELTLQEISQLLWAAQGITEKDKGLRAAPSAGALYPLELYVVFSNGIYHYLPNGHKLERISAKDMRRDLQNASLGQSSVGQAPLDIIITGVYERTRKKYGERAERYVHLEAGHAAQNILLEAVALDLGAVPIGAFDDKTVQEVLSIPSDHQPLYIIPIGYTIE